jgi:hypothetical protein
MDLLITRDSPVYKSQDTVTQARSGRASRYWYYICNGHFGTLRSNILPAHGGVGDVRVEAKDAFEFGWSDLVAFEMSAVVDRITYIHVPLNFNHLFQSIYQEDKAMVIYVSNVTGPQIPIGNDSVLGQLLVTNITLHYVWALDKQFAWDTVGDI